MCSFPFKPLSWLGDSWQAYTEYFQWSPTHNSNSRQIDVKAGQTLQGALVYSESDDSYTLTQTNVNTGAVSTQVVKCQVSRTRLFDCLCMCFCICLFVLTISSFVSNTFGSWAMESVVNLIFTLIVMCVCVCVCV